MKSIAMKQTSDLNKNDWCTPPWLFERLNNVFGFTLDGAANRENALCDFFSSNFNAYMYQDHTIFINPPFNNIEPFLTSNSKNFICLLLPFRPETKLWHKLIWLNATIFVFNKRIQYIHPETKKEVKGAAFPSCLVFFGDLEPFDLTQLKDLGIFIKKYC